MTTTFRKSHSVLLKDLPPELLRKVVDFCADDIAVGRATLLSLSVISKYLRSVTTSRLFEHIYFRDGPQSPGDEILHSVTRFKAAPYFWRHPRTVSLYLNRLKWLGTGRVNFTQPYHYLVLPELVDALAKMPDATELHIRLGAGQGERCLDGLYAAVHWCLARREINIKSLTVSSDNLEALQGGTLFCPEYDFLQALPQLQSICWEGANMCFAPMTTTAPKVIEPRFYRSCSDPRSGFSSHCWESSQHWQFLHQYISPELEHLSVLGELAQFPVSRVLRHLKTIPKLKYLDITDEQTMHGYCSGRELIQSMLPAQPHDRLAYMKHQAATSPLNENRSELARETFDQCEKLQRICFVRSCVGEVYLRGYPDAVADSTGYVSTDVKDADLIEIPQRWHHGVPQTGLLPFPTFTPWEGIQDAM